MHFVLIAEHNAEVCPTSNAEVQRVMQETGPKIPHFADKAGVAIISGPYVNREHTTVIIVEAATAEAVDQFLLDTKLPQWNRVRVLPSRPLAETLGTDIADSTPIF